MAKFYAFNHQGKADEYIDALSVDHELVDGNEYPRVDFVLTDSDVRGRRRILNRFRINGARCFFMYPHTGRPNLVNDIDPAWSSTTAHFVAASGHQDAMLAYDYPHPIHVAGWVLCKIREFQPKPNPKQVLFAPIHPRCAPIDKRLNAEVFRRLEPLARSGDIELTVRHIGSLEKAGLSRVRHRRIKYTAGDLVPSHWHIDRADVVVAHQTFAYMAVARGIPTLMMGEDMPTHLVPSNKPVVYAKNWEKYAGIIAYPLDIVKHADTLALIRRAASTDEDIAEWRGRMIGEQFDPSRALSVVNEYLARPVERKARVPKPNPLKATRKDGPDPQDAIRRSQSIEEAAKKLGITPELFVLRYGRSALEEGRREPS